jgi:hypothetical protein
MISCVDNIANDILLHVNIWLGIELVNLFLLSASAEKWHINPATTQSCQNIEKDIRQLKPPTNKLTTDEQISMQKHKIYEKAR